MLDAQKNAILSPPTTSITHSDDLTITSWLLQQSHCHVQDREAASSYYPQTTVPKADEFLARVFAQHRPHVKAQDYDIGSNDWPAPSLTNEILPLFQCRWASGPQPSFDDPWHQDIIPALQIASPLLTEDYPLLWFSRLTFAERRTKPGYPPRYYLKSSMYAESSETLQKIKANIVQLGRVITLMWVPRGYDPMNKMSYGAPTRTSVTCRGIAISDVQTGLQSKKMDACIRVL